MKISIDINSYPDKLALLYSGGADSTLLYYLTLDALVNCSFKKSLDLILFDRYNKPVEKAVSLYNSIREEFKDTITNLRIIELEDTMPNNLRILETIKIISDDYDAIMWAVNQYPDDTSIRPKTEYTVNFNKFKADDKLRLPFADYKKTDIIETFIKLDLMHILEQTHTCGEPGAVPCGKCFNCRERSWAFSQLSLEPNLGI